MNSRIFVLCAAILLAILLLAFLAILPSTAWFGQPPIVRPPKMTKKSFVYKPQPLPPEDPVFRISSEMDPPVILKKVEVNLAGLEDKQLNGISIFEAVLSKEGIPRNIRVLRTTGDSELDQRAVDTIAQWRYRPASLHGKPVDVYFTVTMSIHYR